MSTRVRRDLSLALFALPLLAFAACKSDSPAPSPGHDAGPDASTTPDLGSDRPNSPDLGPDSGAQPDASKADIASGASDAAAGGSSDAYAYFIKQANGTTSATPDKGTVAVSSTYSSSGNAFKFVSPNYYGTASNGFIALPTTMAGDFTISAEVTISTQNKANNACGIGVGMTTGFAPTDTYAYTLMRNNNNSTNAYYVSGTGAISAAAPTVKFTNGTPLALSFSRSGKNVTFSAGAVGETPATSTLATSSLTDGSNVYGDSAVYPAVSFNNVDASIAKLVIKDGDGKTVFDSATAGWVNYVPAALAVSLGSVSMVKGGSATVTVTANAVGGDVSTVSAVSADPSIATVALEGGTLTVSGVKGGATTITITNTGDPNPSTNSKTVEVAVNDYPTTDNYGSKALTAYPAPGATRAYPDGEFSLTFDSPPTLNKAGTIKIFKLSDGSEADSIAFADEVVTYGTTAIKVGSQLARVDGNTVYFTAHLGNLGYATDYYVVIPTTSIAGTLNGMAFNGLSNLSSVATWKFTTKAAPTLDFTNLTVDGSQTSTATFRSLATALNAVATNATTPDNVTIKVAAGTYRELLRYTGPGSTAQTVTITGPAGNKQGDNCIVQFANGNGINGSTQTRASFYFSGANLVLANITLKNTGIRSQVSQAEALYFASGGNYTMAAYNSSFVSNQDTIQTSGRTWFYKCYIEGNVDFIWGTAQASLFEDCALHLVVDPSSSSTSYSMIVARTGSTVTGDGTVGKGYVVLNSAVTVDANITATFGRNAGAGAYYDQIALINTKFSGDGTLGAGLWNTSTAPAAIGDASVVGWKSSGCAGLNLASLTTADKTSTTIADQPSEYDTRDHILNRVISIKSGVPAGYETVPLPWDTSSLATTWNAP